MKKVHSHRKKEKGRRELYKGKLIKKNPEIRGVS